MRRTRKFVRRSLAGLMAVWLSGLALLVLCPMPARAVASDHCPLAKKPAAHCNQSKQEAKSDLISRSSTQAFDCCGFIPAVFDKTRKVERDTKAVEPAAKPATLNRPFLVALPPVQIAPAYSSYVPVNDRIFIRNRVFRI
jgi:hypothetical protein